jgi:hypothetical protein
MAAMPDEDNGEGSPEQRYFAALELHFARLRGAAVLLSPGDWAVARTWCDRGIPIELVVRTMELLLARRAERDGGAQSPRSRRINSLKYFGPAVDAAWEEMRALTASGHMGVPEPLDVPARLKALAESLPKALPRRHARAAAIAALQGSPPEIEAALAEIDASILAEAVAALDPEGQKEIDKALKVRARALATRLPDAEVERASSQLRDRLVRQRLGLDVLSLFGGPTAGPAPES